MPTEDGDSARHAVAVQTALNEVLAELPDEDRAAALGAEGRRWLSIGMRLGLERPEQARRLLELVAAQEADRAAPPDGAAGGESLAGVPVSESIGGFVTVPVPSSLLARAAAQSSSERASLGPEVTFGWAARLTPDEIQALGRVVHDMLAAGSPPDIGRGFGLTWDAGVRLPRQELDAMFREFTELELTVGGVLAGRDLRAFQEAPRPSGLGGLLNPLVRPTRQRDSEVSAALERGGELGRRGLVALWNVWVAMRCRDLIPRPTFELLVHPWVTVVGPLPEP